MAAQGKGTPPGGQPTDGSQPQQQQQPYGAQQQGSFQRPPAPGMAPSQMSSARPPYPGQQPGGPQGQQPMGPPSSSAPSMTGSSASPVPGAIPTPRPPQSQVFFFSFFRKRFYLLRLVIYIRFFLSDTDATSNAALSRSNSSDGHPANEHGPATAATTAYEPSLFRDEHAAGSSSTNSFVSTTNAPSEAE